MPVRKVAVKIETPAARAAEPARGSGRAAGPAHGAGHEIDPAFHRAILKIALELKKPSARTYDEVVDATIRGMSLDAARFRRYLGENGARNMSLLLATARSAGT